MVHLKSVEFKTLSRTDGMGIHYTMVKILHQLTTGSGVLGFEDPGSGRCLADCRLFRRRTEKIGEARQPDALRRMQPVGFSREMKKSKYRCVQFPFSCEVCNVNMIGGMLSLFQHFNMLLSAAINLNQNLVMKYFLPPHLLSNVIERKASCYRNKDK
uniref:Uncharacterized protein n=1 Tax=Leersia perrieri TaxID=77586 RepID=A0A0D9VEB0_9ORYZ